jgi:PAS domain S-box-containing protein
LPRDVQYPDVPVVTDAAPTDAAARLRELESSLRERERQLEEAHRIANLGTWSWERSTGITSWSDEIYAIFGRSRETYTPRSVIELRNLPNVPATWLHMLDLHQRAIDTGEPYETDIEIERADGSKRWIVSRGEAARWEGGQVVALRGTVQDITERKLNELALAERERDLREAQRAARLGTWRWDRTTDVTTWSEEVYRAFGLDPAGPAPGFARIREMHSPESRLRLEASVQRALTTGESYEHDIELQLPDGSTRWIVARGEVESYSDGQVVALRGTIQDITERKLFELRLSERERDHREAQRIGRMGSWRWKLATNELTWSEEVYSLMERDPSLPVILFSDHPEMFEGDSLFELQSAIDHAVATGESYSVDAWMRLPSGKRICFATLGEPVLDAHGTLVELRGTVRDITDRKLIEEELQQSENRYKSLVLASSDILWTSSSTGFQAGELDAWRAFTGQTLEEVQGWGYFDAVHPEDRELALSTWQQTTAAGANYVHRHRLRRQDGVYRIMEVRAVPSRDAHGNIVEWVGMHTDITDQIEAEQAVRDSQARFQRLYDSDLIGIGFPDSAGQIHDCNDALLRTIGYTRDDLEAGLVRWDLMTPPEYRELDLTHIMESRTRGSCTPYRKEYFRKDGTRVPVMVGFARLEGDKAGSIGFVLDLTAQKRAEEATREREQRFSALAESIPQLVWASAPNGDRIYVNSRYCEYTGMGAEALVGARWREYLHPDDIERTNELWYRSMETGEPYLNEYRIRRHDGMYRSFLVRANPVRNPSGEIERWLGTATDIHDQKLAEEALRRSEKLAATGRLAASIAHEINNPLEAVTNALYLALLDTGLPQDTRTYLKIAEQELARVAQVTTQTLRFHRQSVAALEVDLADVMDSAFSLFAPRFEACGISVDRGYKSGHLLLCRADELRQVFANFLSNALDATRQGGRVRLRIRPCTGPDSSPGLRVIIADTGHGIPPHLRKAIFEPFISTKETTGTGLGLWVSDGIVQKHKGHISLRSSTAEAHHGTVFSIFFPYNGIQTT